MLAADRLPAVLAKIQASPPGWEFLQDRGVFLSQLLSRETFALFHHISRWAIRTQTNVFDVS